jgi:hypothetical protein
MKKGISSMTQPEPSNAVFSPGSAEDTKDFKQLLMNQVRAGGGTKAIDTKGTVRK